LNALHVYQLFTTVTVADLTHDTQWAVVQDLDKKRLICKYTAQYERHTICSLEYVSLINSDFGYLNSQVPDEVAIPLFRPKPREALAERGIVKEGKVGIEGMCYTITQVSEGLTRRLVINSRKRSAEVSEQQDNANITKCTKHEDTTSSCSTPMSINDQLIQLQERMQIMEEVQKQSATQLKHRLDNLEAVVRDIHANSCDAWHTDRCRANYMSIVLDGLQNELHSFLSEADVWPKVQSTRRELFDAGRLSPVVRYVGDEELMRHSVITSDLTSSQSGSLEFEGEIVDGSQLVDESQDNGIVV
jgi:hypothetical protein